MEQDQYINEQPDNPAKDLSDQKQEPDKKIAKKSSAFAAAAVYRSPTHSASRNAFRDLDYRNTGTNVDYREDGDVS